MTLLFKAFSGSLGLGTLSYLWDYSATAPVTQETVVPTGIAQIKLSSTALK